MAFEWVYDAFDPDKVISPNPIAVRFDKQTEDHWLQEHLGYIDFAQREAMLSGGTPNVVIDIQKRVGAYLVRDVGFYEGLPLSVDMADPINPQLVVTNVVHLVEVDDPRIEVVEVGRQELQSFPIRDISSILLSSQRPHGSGPAI